MIKSREQKRKTRQARIRAKISGTAERPRMAVYKSNKYITVQLIDDVNGKTIASCTTQSIEAGSPAEKSQKAGKAIAELATKAGIKSVVFDRGGFIYTGKIKALADAAREAGLKF